MYDRILLATDGSVASENAEAHALELADGHGAELHALYVVDEDVYTAYSGDEYVDEAEGPEHGLEAHGEETLRDLQRRAADADVPLVTSIEYGHPHERIVEYAEEHDVDVLVLGTKLRPTEYRNLIGSVTDRVVRLADRPVLVVKTEAETATAADSGGRGVSGGE